MGKDVHFNGTSIGLTSRTGLANDVYGEIADGNAVAVSPANKARIRFNLGASQLEQSLNGGAWAALGGGGFSRFTWLPQGSTYATIQAALNNVAYDGVFLEPGALAYSITANLTIPSGKFLVGGFLNPDPAGTRAILTLSSGFSIVAQGGTLAYCNVVWTAGSAVNAITGTFATCEYVHVTTSAGNTAVRYAFSGGFNLIHNCSALQIMFANITANPPTNYQGNRISECYMEHTYGAGAYGINVGAGLTGVQIEKISTKNVDTPVWVPFSVARLKISYVYINKCASGVTLGAVGVDNSVHDIGIEGGCNSGVTITSASRGFELYNVLVDSPSSTGIVFAGAANSYLRIDNLYVTNALGVMTSTRGIDLNNLNYSTVSNLYVSNLFGNAGGCYGINVANGSRSVFTNLEVDGLVGSVNNTGIRFYSVYEADATNLTAYGCGCTGIDLDSNVTCDFVNVQSRDNTGAGTNGVRIQNNNSSTFGTVTGIANPNYGIYFHANTNCVITNTITMSNVTGGFLEDNSTRCRFDTITSTSDSQFGLRAGSGSTDTHWSNVSVSLCVGGGFTGVVLVNTTAHSKMEGLKLTGNTIAYSFGTGWQVEMGQEKVVVGVTFAMTPYNALLADEVILVDASGGAVVVNLPLVATLTGKHYYIKKTDSSTNTVTIQEAGGSLIDGVATKVLRTLYEVVHIISNGTSFSIITETKIFGMMVQNKKGANVASANNCDVLLDGNSFLITGAVQINGILASGKQAGTEITLYFDSNPVLKHNTAAGPGYASLLLASATDFNATADDTITLFYDGTYWREKCRTAI